MVERLNRARHQGETVLLFGDYDVDGVTATALLHELFTQLGWRVSLTIPDRMDDGYGLTASAVAKSQAAHAASLVLAVDCGVNAAPLIRSLQQEGTEVMVLDHHDPGAAGWPPTPCVHPWTLPHADHPARPLCSVGCAFKLAHALVKDGRSRGCEISAGIDIRAFLDLVALGTVSDLVPLTGENRILVTSGLQRLQQTQRAGLRALMSEAGIAGQLGVYDIGFQLGPRINAAGRLGTARPALDLLLTTKEGEARALAAELDATNRERQALERATSEAVFERLRDRFDARRDHVVVEGDPAWHLGVVGIVASRVVKEFHRPALILGGDGTLLRGSGRSIDGFDLAQALHRCSDLLETGGGHPMAAGLTIRPERLDALRERLDGDVESRVPLEGLTPKLVLDDEVSLGDLSQEMLEWLGRLEPTGQGNPRPRFAVRGVQLAGPVQRMGNTQQHVRFRVTDGGRAKPVVWWGGGDKSWPEGVFDLAVEPGLNHYNGRTTVQLKLLDWRQGAQVT
jgi:single-stranded-DNA-specific exonuclease